MPGVVLRLAEGVAGDHAGRDASIGPASAARPAVAITRLVLLLFLVAQVCDGVFTYVAVHALGIGAEGNRLLAVAMTSLGPLPTLIAAKCLAAAAGVLLYVRHWHGTLAIVTVLYAIAALGPWLLVDVSWGSHG
jgi:hypothetical protein